MGHTLSSTPFLLVIAIISSSISYFMVGLHPGFVHFLYFMLSLFLSLSVVEGLMMAIASVVPNFLMGIIIGAGIQVFAFVNNIFYKLLVQDFCLINYLLVLGDVHVSCWIFSIAKWYPKTSMEVSNYIHCLWLLGHPGISHFNRMNWLWNILVIVFSLFLCC